MKAAGAASAVCEHRTSSRAHSGLGKPPLLQTDTVVRLGMRFLHTDLSTAQLAVRAYAGLSEAIQHVVLIGRGSTIVVTVRLLIVRCSLCVRFFAPHSKFLYAVRG